MDEYPIFGIEESVVYGVSFDDAQGSCGFCGGEGGGGYGAPLGSVLGLGSGGGALFGIGEFFSDGSGYGVSWAYMTPI